MSKEIKSILVWGRNLPLKIIYDVYSGEEILDTQKKALNVFFEKSGDILSDRSQIEKYCIAHNGDEIGDVVDNIFKYVMPVSIFIPRNKDKRVVVLLCNYRFDVEHGLAIVFENEKLKKIGPQDIIL